MTILDNCIDYLTSLRDEGDDVLVNMDDGAIQREAARMADRMVSTREAFMAFELDTDPEA